MEYEANGFAAALQHQALGSPSNVPGQIGAATEDPLAKLLREYRDAKYRFDNACQIAAKSLQERESANQALEKLSVAVEKAVASGRYDPTHPQPDEKPVGCATSYIKY